MSTLYHYFAHKAADLQAKALASGHATFKALDYGCGDGEMLQAIRAAGVDCVGAEVFYAASNARQMAEEKGLLNSLIFEVVDGRIPFPDHSFDLVVSNQVFEHVEALDALLQEIRRVLKPGGRLVAAFPLQDCLIEYHMMVPFTHWFSKTSPLRVPYTDLAYRLGLGNYRNRPREQWVKDKLHFIDAYCCFRTRKEMEQLLNPYFDFHFIESELLSYRLHQKSRLKPVAGVLDQVQQLPPVERIVGPTINRLHQRLMTSVLEGVVR